MAARDGRYSGRLALHEGEGFGGEAATQPRRREPPEPLAAPCGLPIRRLLVVELQSPIFGQRRRGLRRALQAVRCLCDVVSQIPAVHGDVWIPTDHRLALPASSQCHGVVADKILRTGQSGPTAGVFRRHRDDNATHLERLGIALLIRQHYGK